MNEIKLYKRPIKSLKLLGLSVLFVAGGIAMISNERFGSADYIVGWVCTCFFGLGILVGLFHMFDRRPQIVITENGIWDRTTNQDEIKWEQIKRAYPLDIHRQKFVSLTVDDTFVIKNRVYKWASKLNKAVGAQAINLSVSQLTISAKEMSDFVKEMSAAEKLARPDLIKKYFDK
ncbi:MAG: hypothetical protein RL660_2787 [Bacteroidota bacterium]|jgi:hypothetical protein